jgi:hypothetical protein
MNWDAIGSIGEVLGSIGVLVTLIYFGIQLRKSETATRNATASAQQAARLQTNDQRLLYAELLLRANSGADLTDLEKSQLQLIFESQYQAMFFAFMNTLRQDEGGAIQARNFARFLCDNPAFERLWPASKQRIQRDSQGVPNPFQDEWLENVSDHISQLKTLRESE